MSVGLILVSHSHDLASGTADLARQMGGSIRIATAGGTEDGELGTSFDAITAAIADMAEQDGAVLLYDLGSALLTAETALEFSDPEVAATIRIVDAPLVEGALAAVVAAAGGADLDGVARAAVEARSEYAGAAPSEPAGAAVAAAPAGGASSLGPEPEDASVSTEAELINPLGLHARPAAALVRALDGWDARVRIGRPGMPMVDLRSVLRVVSLALRGGEKAMLAATGPDAQAAVRAVSELIASGFGEATAAGIRLSRLAMGAAPARMGNAPANRAATASWRPPTIRHGVLTAQAGAPGLAVGPLVRLDRAPAVLSATEHPSAGVDDERRRLADAIRAAGRKLAAGNQFEAAHAVLLTDPELREAADQRLADGAEGAATAWWAVVTTRADALAAEPDELVAARAVDVREAGAAVLAELGVVIDRLPAVLTGAVVLADDLGPGEVPVLVERGSAAVVLTRSSLTAHAVIVARGLGLPMVLRAGDELSRVPTGTVVVLDGDTGTVQIDPDDAATAEARQRIEALRAATDRRVSAAAAPVVLADGRAVLVVANVGSLADAHAAVRNGADGVGLLRTELLVLDRESYPDEDTQRADLRAIFDVLGDRPVVVRVLDAGGDKPVTALNLDHDRNGFLGVRGLRYLLAHPDLLRTQLRAIFRAAVGHRVSVMAPMVSIAAEVVAFKQAVADAVESLRTDGSSFSPPDQIGVMIEVPAAALAADEICTACDFVSVGSNDLTSYLMAADRTITEVADLLDPASTAVQRALDVLCDYAQAAGTPVAVCGEIAGLVDQAPRLVERGVHELSVAPARIPVIKELLRDWRPA